LPHASLDVGGQLRRGLGSVLRCDSLSLLDHRSPNAFQPLRCKLGPLIDLRTRSGEDWVAQVVEFVD
jgi:hypothetical protein